MVIFHKSNQPTHCFLPMFTRYLIRSDCGGNFHPKYTYFRQLSGISRNSGLRIPAKFHDIFDEKQITFDDVSAKLRKNFRNLILKCKLPNFQILQISKFPPNHLQTLRGSFSAVSTPILQRKYQLGKLSTRSTMFTCVSTAQTSRFQQNSSMLGRYS